MELYSYAEFEAIDHDDKYRMMDIAARGSNRDGAALRFVAEQLSKRPEDVKILVIVSDGQPADTGYYGTAAEEGFARHQAGIPAVKESCWSQRPSEMTNRISSAFTVIPLWTSLI